jgi:hypothetical protein
MKIGVLVFPLFVFSGGAAFADRGATPDSASGDRGLQTEAARRAGTERAVCVKPAPPSYKKRGYWLPGERAFAPPRPRSRAPRSASRFTPRFTPKSSKQWSVDEYENVCKGVAENDFPCSLNTQNVSS